MTRDDEDDTLDYYANDDELDVAPLTQDEKDAMLAEHLPSDISARAIKSFMDEFVVGQEDAKIAFSLILSMHLRWFTTRESLHKAPNALLVGPTGVGKTHSLKTAARYLKLPYAIVDATSLVPSGIAGLQIEDIIEDLAESANTILKQRGSERFEDDDLELASRGVIFIDEFDKLRDNANSETVSGALARMTQRKLLKLIEGSTYTVGVARGSRMRPQRFIDSSGILCVASGAFAGIESAAIRAARGAAIIDMLRPGAEVISKDLVTYGFMPELIARLPIVINFEHLSARDLLAILINKGISPLGVWERHFSHYGKEIHVEPDALNEIARRARALSMGARGLQQILFPLLASRAYHFEQSTESSLTLTQAMVANNPT